MSNRQLNYKNTRYVNGKWEFLDGVPLTPDEVKRLNMKGNVGCFLSFAFIIIFLILLWAAKVSSDEKKKQPVVYYPPASSEFYDGQKASLDGEPKTYKELKEENSDLKEENEVLKEELNESEAVLEYCKENRC